MKAFPLAQNPGAIVLSDGADLRDYFAAAVDMAPYADLIREWAALKGAYTTDDLAACIAAIRYAEADAILARRAPVGAPLPPIGIV